MTSAKKKSPQKKYSKTKLDRIFKQVENNWGVPEGFSDRVDPFIDGLYRHYFRVDLQGLENIPEETILFVGNHNGLFTFETLMLTQAFLKHFKGRRRAVGLAHGVAIDNPMYKWISVRVGAIPAHPEVAREALRRKVSLLVYPGGEKEAMRPYADRKKVDFYGRKGFLKLALKSKVRIVPIVSVGAHESYIILDRGEEFAERLGLKKHLRIHGFPITAQSVFFLWCVVTGMVTFFPLLLAPGAFASIFIPLPTKMTFRILPPIDLRSWLKDGLTEDENLQQLYDRFLTLMQSVHSEEYAKRRFPVIG